MRPIQPGPDADLIDYTMGASEKDEEEAIRAIPNPRPEDRRPKETRRPRSELIATPPEQQPIELGHSRNSGFGLLSGFGLRVSAFGLRISGLQNMLSPQLAGL